MSNVVEFKRPEPEPKLEPSLVGKVRCIECTHEWDAEAPAGTHLLECPSCGTHKGAWVGIVEPPNERWECNCGNQLFFVTQKGFNCAKCGAEQRGF